MAKLVGRVYEIDSNPEEVIEAIQAANFTIVYSENMDTYDIHVATKEEGISPVLITLDRNGGWDPFEIKVMNCKNLIKKQKSYRDEIFKIIKTYETKG